MTLKFYVRIKFTFYINNILFKNIIKIYFIAKSAEDSIFKRKLPSNINVVVGKPLNLQAQVEGSPSDIQWFKNGIPLTANDHVKMDIQPDGTVTLKIDQATLDDKGIYELKVTNGKGTATSSSDVIVAGKSTF